LERGAVVGGELSFLGLLILLQIRADNATPINPVWNFSLGNKLRTGMGRGGRVSPVPVGAGGSETQTGSLPEVSQWPGAPTPLAYFIESSTPTLSASPLKTTSQTRRGSLAG